MGTISKPGVEVKRGSSPDETRPFAAHGHADIHKLEGGVVIHGIFEPGWRWSKDIGPIAGTKSCQAPHLGYLLSGHMKIVMDGGTEVEIGPGDFVKIPPGHDAWVVGDEACDFIDFGGYEQYAQRAVLPAGAQLREEPEKAFRR